MEYTVVAKPDGTIEVVPVNKAQGIMVPAYETSQLDLVDQINQEPRNLGVPMTLEQTMAGSVLPPDPRRFQSIFPPEATGIMQQAPLDGVSDMSIIDETTNDEQSQEYIDQVKESQEGGLAKLFKTILGFAIPGSSFFMGNSSPLQGIKALNQRLRNTDFAKSSSLADYFDAKSYGGRDARDRAASQNMREARAIQRQVDMRPSAIQTNQDRGRGNRPGGANYSAPSKPSRASSYRDSSSFGKSFHG